MTLFEVTEATPRPPGWQLIANRAGSQGWHLVASVGMASSVTTACGIVGRVIRSDARQIARCPVCASAPTP